MNRISQDKDSAKVLLVEDDPFQITFITALLARHTRQHFQLESVGRLSEARTRLATGGIDVILLDLGLPDSHGIESVRMLHDSARGIPIIVLTGDDNEDTAYEAMSNGAQDYLVKSAVDGPSLIRGIRYAIQRHRHDQLLTEHRRRIQLLMENIPDLRIYFKDEAGCFLDVNPALAKVYGFLSSNDLIGKTDFDLFSKEHAAVAREDEETILRTGKTIAGKVERELFPDGTVRWALTTKMPLYGEAGEIIGTCGISRDITGLKQAEEQLLEANTRLTKALSELLQLHQELKSTQLQLIQAEKLQSLGQMAAGVAHEIKNPLGILQMGIEYLGEYLAGREEQINALIAELKDAVQRANTIIRDMLDYSAAADLTLEPVALDAIISKALRFVRYELLKGKVTVVTRLSENLPNFPLDAPKIQQVLVNVFLNACQAMPGGGTLTVTTREKTVEADDCVAAASGPRAGFQQGDRLAVIEISDTGKGIAEENICRIFGSFFTTKERGSGTGLGLSIAKKIVELHGGSISIGNVPEGGARVTILLRFPSALSPAGQVFPGENEVTNDKKTDCSE